MEESFMYKDHPWRRVTVYPHEHWVMGVDPGQSVDYTAISVLRHAITPLDPSLDTSWDVNEDTCRTTQKVDVRFDIVGLRRLPLGTLYPDQVTMIQEALAAVRHPCDLVIDDTSNFAVGDLLAERGLRPVRVTFTSGAEVTRIKSRKYGVPKSLLVGNVDAKLHCNKLRFAKDLTEADVA